MFLSVAINVTENNLRWSNEYFLSNTETEAWNIKYEKLQESNTPGHVTLLRMSVDIGRSQTHPNSTWC